MTAARLLLHPVFWRRRQRSGSCALLIALCCTSACATVAPYERERLARADMDPGHNGDATAGEEHATAYREGSSGAIGSSGGGCGCN
jgi:hypothetical protein